VTRGRVRGPGRGPGRILARARLARGGRERGASAVELAILAPALIFASLLIVQFAIWFDARHAALAAAQQGDLVAREDASVNLEAIDRMLEKFPEADIVFKDGKFTVAGTDKSAAWGDVALNAYIAHKFAGQELEPGLKESAFYDPTNFTFPAGCHICEVEVDPQTGESAIVAWTAVDDFGTVINPMIVEGQVHGGIAQGVGQALLEGAVYDKDGQLVTGSLMDYCMPRAHDLPTLKVEMTRTPSPSNPLGIKGCGEAGAIAAPVAVINAITDAIGSEDLAMPATAQAVWQALQKAHDRRKAA